MAERLTFISKTGSQSYFALTVLEPVTGKRFLISSNPDWKRFKERLSKG